MKKYLLALSLFSCLGYASEPSPLQPDPPLFPKTYSFPTSPLKRSSPGIDDANLSTPDSPKVKKNDTVHYFTPEEAKQRKATPPKTRPVSPQPAPFHQGTLSLFTGEVIIPRLKETEPD
jgi:hypothetical protein